MAKQVQYVFMGLIKTAVPRNLTKDSAAFKLSIEQNAHVLKSALNTQLFLRLFKEIYLAQQKPARQKCSLKTL